MCADCGVDLQVRGKVRGLTLSDCERGSVVARLYRVGTSIAMMIGRDIYGDLRSCDRIEIDRLQARLIDWMCTGPESDLLTGVEIWQDVCELSAALGTLGEAGTGARTGGDHTLPERERLAIETARRILAEDFTPLLLARLGPVLDVLHELDDRVERPQPAADAGSWSRGLEGRVVTPAVAAAATWRPGVF